MTSLAVSPGGKLVIDVDGGEAAHPSAAKRIAAAFAIGTGAGLLHLATAELATELSTSLAFGRDLGAAFLTRLCAQPEEDRAKADVSAPIESLFFVASWADAVPAASARQAQARVVAKVFMKNLLG